MSKLMWALVSCKDHLASDGQLVIVIIKYLNEQIDLFFAVFEEDCSCPQHIRSNLINEA